MDRRDFVKIAAAGLVGSAFSWGKKQKGHRPPIAFSTLGCPEWDWDTILATARRWDYAALELRGFKGRIDLTEEPLFQGESLKTVLKDLKAMNIPIACVGSSVSFHDPDSDAGRKAFDDARRWIDLSSRLQSPFVRMFGDRLVEGESRETTISRIVERLQKAAEYALPSGVAILIESHGDFTDSRSLAEILEKTQSPAVGLLWDTHHTFVSGKEEPEFTFEKLGRWVRHTHIKDSVAHGAGRRYVLTGGGQVPVEGFVETLAAGGYRGYYCFEWEKVWHPDIDDPETAIPHYSSVMREYLRKAGVPEVFD